MKNNTLEQPLQSLSHLYLQQNQAKNTLQNHCHLQSLFPQQNLARKVLLLHILCHLLSLFPQQNPARKVLLLHILCHLQSLFHQQSLSHLQNQVKNNTPEQPLQSLSHLYLQQNTQRNTQQNHYHLQSQHFQQQNQQKNVPQHHQQSLSRLARL